MAEQCSKCGGATMGWKCDMCGSEADNHVSDHSCGGDHCVLKCEGCSEAQTNCSCS